MDYKEAVLVVTSHALCCLSDGQPSCEMCPAYDSNISDEYACDGEFWTEERLRDAVETITSFEKTLKSDFSTEK